MKMNGSTATVNYKGTMYACFTGFVVQAIINNFVPLLFLTFQESYGIPISQITFLVTFNFGFQLLVDAVAPGIINKIGDRAAAVAAHIFASLGLILLTVLPAAFADPFAGLMVAVIIYALGGGLLEVLMSPIVEACPSENKQAAMSLLHSFYCWGHVGVVILSTLFFSIFGIENWKIMALLWAIVPTVNAVCFMKVPIAPLLEDGDSGMSIRELFGSRMFWMFAMLMVCAGASELSVSQWASTFVEKELGISKTIGDLAGPMLFAVMMGMARTLFGRSEQNVDVKKVILSSGGLCLVGYLLVSLSPNPVLGLIGCGICGFSVGVFWPGTFSMASAAMPRGGMAMFALLALAGDLGCSLGPTVVGEVSGLLGDNLKMGILAAIVFPAVLVGTMLWNLRSKKKFVSK